CGTTSPRPTGNPNSRPKTGADERRARHGLRRHAFQLPTYAAEPSWRRDAQTVQEAVEADLRRRREELDRPPTAPQLLDDALRQRSLFLLPDLDADEPEDDA
ncbi:hypothetical protein ACFTXM_49410, partial [Streptomyces sp. NPDC056930]